MVLQPGQLIANYRVVRLLGQGGMGTVYEVERTGLRKRMALKVFAADGSKKAFLRKRFLAEGRILSRLDHPRLVRVFDLEIDAGTGVPYFAMDLVLDSSGEPCTLERWRKDGTPSAARPTSTSSSRCRIRRAQQIRAFHTREQTVFRSFGCRSGVAGRRQRPTSARTGVRSAWLSPRDLTWVLHFEIIRSI